MILPAALAALALAACNAATRPAATAAAIIAPDVPVAFIALEGAPEAVLPRLTEALSLAAGDRSIRLVETDADPAYQVKGYFAAASAAGGATLTYALDVFDAKDRLVRRLEGAGEMSGTAPAADPWAGIDDQAMARLAASSMNDLARFLASNPDAAGG
jgi:hypothetical protein